MQSPECCTDRVENFIFEMAEFTEPERPYTRQTYSSQDFEAKRWLLSEMQALDLDITVDYAGNIFAVMKGYPEDAGTILVGSHIDTVKAGGRYDGVVGVAAAFEILRVIKEHNLNPPKPVGIVVYVEEEGATFSYGLLGSRYHKGRLSKDEIDVLTNDAGMTFREGLDKFDALLGEFGLERQERCSLKITDVFEVHCEQAGVLETSGKTIGVVTGIFGNSGYYVKIFGEADHAGATPMVLRKFNVEAMAKIILELNSFILENMADTVGTVGDIKLFPGSFNVIPGEVQFSLDIRSLSAENLKRTQNHIFDFIEKTCKEMGLEYSVQQTYGGAPVYMSDSLIDKLSKHADNRGYSNMKLPSGAGHDIMVMADDETNTALLFVANTGGKSHCPEEESSADDIAKSATVILDTIMDI